MKRFQYVRECYGVPAEYGRRVIVSNNPGIIVADRGHYIGVTFDDDKPGTISNCHPTSNVQYGEIGKVRQVSRSSARYHRYLEYGDGFDNFIEYCRWDAQPERSWNTGHHE